MLSFDIRHDILDSYNYHDNENDDLTSCLILIYSSTNRTPDMHVLLILLVCSCSFPKSDNYLTNHKNGTTYIRSGKTCGYQYMFVFTVVLGMLCN